MVKKRLYGLTLTLGTGFLLLVVIFGSQLRDPGSTFFATGGDGLKAYFGANYHVSFDTLAMRSSAMNYPFGEMISFTDCQPPVVNTIRMVTAVFPSFAGHTTAILNLLMLISILLGAVFLYMILTDNGVAWWYAGIVAVGIAFLSPQLGRMGGHFSLSWVFWIPITVWLIIRFDRSRRLVYSVLLGITTFIAGGLHFYYIGFAGFLLFGYWFYRFVEYRKTSTFWYRDLLHIFLQFIVPVLLLHSMVLLNDDVTDRTTWPFGFGGSIAHPVAVFLPSGAPWAFVARTFTVFRHISWESWAYIGTAALAGTVAGLFFMVRRIYLRKPFWKVSRIRSMNLLFWLSFAALLFSFGIPFIFGLEFLYDYLGPFRQIRVSARFAWIFFYLINLVVFTSLYRKAFISTPRWWWKVICGCAVAMLMFEAVFNARGVAAITNNRIPELEDRGNFTPPNQWVKEIEPNDYQAILPLPWFHVGSENIWIEGTEEGKEAAMIASLKTGLPLMGSMLSRTSLSQTFMSYALLLEPLQRLELADFLPSEKPLLVMIMKGYDPSPSEKWLLRDATPVVEGEKFSFLALPVNQVRSRHETWRRRIIDEFDSSRLFPYGEYLVSDVAGYIGWHSFDETGAAVTLRGRGAFSFQAGEKVLLATDTLSRVAEGTNLTIGFWIYNFQEDATLRTRFELVQKESVSGEVISKKSSQLFEHLKGIQDDWALIELDVPVEGSGVIIELFLHHNVLRHGEFIVDELLIRSEDIDVWQSSGRTLIYNGRSFLRRQIRM